VYKIYILNILVQHQITLTTAFTVCDRP